MIKLLPFLLLSTINWPYFRYSLAIFLYKQKHTQVWSYFWVIRWYTNVSEQFCNLSFLNFNRCRWKADSHQGFFEFIPWLIEGWRKWRTCHPHWRLPSSKYQFLDFSTKKLSFWGGRVRRGYPRHQCQQRASQLRTCWWCICKTPQWFKVDSTWRQNLCKFQWFRSWFLPKAPWIFWRGESCSSSLTF